MVKCPYCKVHMIFLVRDIWECDQCDTRFTEDEARLIFEQVKGMGMDKSISRSRPEVDENKLPACHEKAKICANEIVCTNKKCGVGNCGFRKPHQIGKR